MDDDRFDHLTRALATGVSRRAALRTLIGSALGLAAGTLTKKVQASNMDCAAFYAQVFGPGPERGKCVSDAANGAGLCIQCGANPSLLCTKPDGTKSCPVACVPNDIFDPVTCQCVCVPIECGPQDCGQIPNGCGGTLDCTAGCCDPTTCEEAGATCGKLFDGCGVLLDCGECTLPQTCGGGGIVNQCGCTPTTCAQAGANCGQIFDGCSVLLNCGECTPPDTCGGGGIANQCGCTPVTCEDTSENCGTLDSGCGVIIDCGPCQSCAACAPVGTSCSVDDDCCSQFCVFGQCRVGENGCLQEGDTCTPGSTGIGCCRGLCTPLGNTGCCSCTAANGPCAADNECCLGYCVPAAPGGPVLTECCTATADPCVLDFDCCGGHCVDGICDEGAAGTPCHFAGDCINACEDFLCTCSTDNFCYDDADCCAGFTCNASEFTVPPFAGICG